jgi:hypothetical protein
MTGSETAGPAAPGEKWVSARKKMGIGTDIRACFARYRHAKMHIGGQT